LRVKGGGAQLIDWAGGEVPPLQLQFHIVWDRKGKDGLRVLGRIMEHMETVDHPTGLGDPLAGEVAKEKGKSAGTCHGRDGSFGGQHCLRGTFWGSQGISEVRRRGLSLRE